MNRKSYKNGKRMLGNLKIQLSRMQKKDGHMSSNKKQELIK